MTAQAVEPLVVTEPGVYTDMPADVYLADPVPEGSLSASGARLLLPPSCPAKFKWARDNGRPEKRAFDFGHAAHQLVLGVGPEVVIVKRTAKDGTTSDAEDYHTKSAQECRDAAYAEGRVPLLAKEFERVKGMASALLKHPEASALFDPVSGLPEQSLFWPDPFVDVWRRARLDWLPDKAGRVLVADYKTCDSADPVAIAKAVYSYGYHMQGAWYVDGVTTLGLADDAGFALVCQEKTEPYLITVVELDGNALRVGRERNHQAVETYAECSAADSWPGYSDGVTLISLPPWADKYQGDEDL